MRRKLSALLLVLPFLLVIASCKNDNPAPPTGPDSLFVEFLNPLNGDSVAAGPITVQVRWTGLQFDCPGIGGADVPGHGHWHLFLDNAYTGLSCTDTQTLDLTGASVGKHKLTASLVRNDHTIIDADKDAHISINVQ